MLEHAALIGREVRRDQRDGQPTRVVVASRTYDAAIDDVWDAITSAERIPRWFLPISGDLRLGGRYQIEGNAGGLVEECEPPDHLAITWEYRGDVSWVDARLVGVESGTTLIIEHARHRTDDEWVEYGPGDVGVGWDMMINGLNLHLGTGMAIDPAEAAAWMASDEARALITASSDAWGQANIAAGADESAALAAAARTTAAYTGAPAPTS